MQSHHSLSQKVPEKYIKDIENLHAIAVLNIYNECQSKHITWYTQDE